MVTGSAAEADLARTDVIDVAKLAGVAHGPRLGLGGRVAVAGRRAREELADSVGGRDHARRFGRIERERLLAEDVLASFERGQRGLGVSKWRRTHDDSVDLGPTQQVRQRL